MAHMYWRSLILAVSQLNALLRFFSVLIGARIWGTYFFPFNSSPFKTWFSERENCPKKLLKSWFIDTDTNILWMCVHLLRIVLFVFVALRPKSTAMVIAGRSVHLTTLFPGQA